MRLNCKIDLYIYVNSHITKEVNGYFWAIVVGAINKMDIQFKENGAFDYYAQEFVAIKLHPNITIHPCFTPLFYTIQMDRIVFSNLRLLFDAIHFYCCCRS